MDFSGTTTVLRMVDHLNLLEDREIEARLSRHRCSPSRRSGFMFMISRARLAAPRFVARRADNSTSLADPSYLLPEILEERLETSIHMTESIGVEAVLVAGEAIRSALLVRFHRGVRQPIRADPGSWATRRRSKRSPRCSRHDVVAAYVPARHHSANVAVHRNDLRVREGIAAVDSPRLGSKGIARADRERSSGLNVVAGRPGEKHVLDVEWPG